MAHSDDEINAALTAAGFSDLKECVAHYTTKGMTLTDIARELGLKPPRFWPYYQQWCRDHAEPLRLGDQ
jgi:hypothetical protein